MSLIADSDSLGKNNKMQEANNLEFEDFDEDNGELDEKDDGDCLSEPSTSNHQSGNTQSKFDESSLLANDDNFIDLNYSEEESGDEERQAKFYADNNPKSMSSNTEGVIEKAIDISSEDNDSEEDEITKYSKSDNNNISLNGTTGELISDEDGAEIGSKKGDKIDIISEDGEIDDLEEGELKSDSDDDIPVVNDRLIPEFDSTTYLPKNNIIPSTNRNFTIIPTKITASNRNPEDGVCKFFLRGNCNWGEGCKYFHPPETEHAFWFHKLRLGSSNHQPILPPQLSPQDHFQKPIALLSMSFGANNTPKAAVNTVENVWERGLRQARELCAKKNYYDKFTGRDSNDKSLEEERKQRFSDKGSAEGLVKRRLISLKSYDLQEEFYQKPGTSLKNSERVSEDISSSESSYKLHKNSNRSSSNYNRSRSHSLDLESQDRRLFSKRENKYRSSKTNSSRFTLNNSTTAEYSDPWARNRRSSPISDCSLNSKDSARKRDYQSPHSEALSPVSSDRSTPFEPPLPRLFKSRKSPRKYCSRRSSSDRLQSDDSSRDSSPLTNRRSRSRTSGCFKRRKVKPDMVSSSTHSSRDSSLSHKEKRQKINRRKSDSLSPYEKNARQNFGTNTLRSLLVDKESVTRTGDLAEFRIPKKRRLNLEEKDEPSSSKSKFNSRKPLDLNKFFEKSDADAPAAYRIPLNVEDSDSDRRSRRRHRKDEISLNSSGDSSRSTSSNSSVDNTRPRKNEKCIKSLAKKPFSSLDKDTLKEKEWILEPMQISSDEDEKNESNKKIISKNSHKDSYNTGSPVNSHSKEILTISKSVEPNEGDQLSVKDDLKISLKISKKVKNDLENYSKPKNEKTLLWEKLKNVEAAISKKQNKNK